MALRQGNDVGAVELAVEAHIVQIVLGTIALNGRGKVTQSGLGADNGRRLAASSSLNMLNQLKQLGLIIGTGSGEVLDAAEIGRGRAQRV